MENYEYSINLRAIIVATSEEEALEKIAEMLGDLGDEIEIVGANLVGPA